MMRGTETGIVLILAFVILPFTVVVMIGAHVPVGLWIGLAVACLVWIPAHRWSQR